MDSLGHHLPKQGQGSHILSAGQYHHKFMSLHLVQTPMLVKQTGTHGQENLRDRFETGGGFWQDLCKLRTVMSTWVQHNILKPTHFVIYYM